MIHQLPEGQFVISSHRVWIPGAYDTRATAQYAFQFCDEILDQLQYEANVGKPEFNVITMADLKKARKEGRG